MSTIKYELICGECRFRASIQAEREAIPAMCMKLNDPEVIELQLVENSQRADVHPGDDPLR